MTPSTTQALLSKPNKALQLTANPLRGLSAAELGRYAAKWQTRGVVTGLT